MADQTIPQPSADRKFGDLSVVKALFGGAGVGASLVTAAMMAIGMLNGGWTARPAGEPKPGPLESLPLALPFLTMVMVIAYIVWLIGLVALGAPGWFLLHRIGQRSLGVAIAYGFLLTLAVGATFTGGFTALALMYATPLAAVGAMVGAAVWFFGYRT